MKAARVHGPGGPASVVVEEVPEPAPGPDEVLIEVAAAGLSHADLLRTQGLYQDRSEYPFVLGGELAGRVLSAPVGSGLSEGQAVAAVVGTGGAAEYAAVSVERVLQVPPGLSARDAASMVLNLLTADFAVAQRGALCAGEEVVVLGAGGGIGTAAVQVARARGAGRITGVASTESRRAAARSSGASRTVTIEELVGLGRFADMLVDPVGGQAALRALPALRDFGRHVVVGFSGGELTAPPLNRAVFRNLAHVGAGWGTFAARHPERVQESWARLSADLAAGRLHAVIGAQGGLHDVSRLLDDLATRAVAGKVVISLRE